MRLLNRHHTVDVFCGFARLEQIDIILSLYFTWLTSYSSTVSVVSVAYWYDEHVCLTNVDGAECEVYADEYKYQTSLSITFCWCGNFAACMSQQDQCGRPQISPASQNTHNAPSLALHCYKNQEKINISTPAVKSYTPENSIVKLRTRNYRLCREDYPMQILLAIGWVGLFPT